MKFISNVLCIVQTEQEPIETERTKCIYINGHLTLFFFFSFFFLNWTIIAFAGFPSDEVVKKLPANSIDARDTGSSLWVGEILWSRKWQPTLVFLPVKFHDRGAWKAIVHSVAESLIT